MILVEILNTLLNAQEAAANVSDCAATVNMNGDLLSMCPASAFTAVGAALSTEGYFMQSDILYYLRFGTYNAWAPLLYICAAIGGMMSMVMGAPPKNYVWFFIGPALYAWLIDTTQYVQGVSWRVAGRQQDQAEVWRLAEVGLLNTGIVARYNSEFVGPVPPGQSGAFAVYNDRPPALPVEVATPFLWWDEVTSGTAQWLSNWTGIYRAYDGSGGKNSSIATTGSSVGGEGKWFLLSNTKWQILDSITDARLHNAELRDAFETFLSTECGDKLADSIDQARYIAFANTRGSNIDADKLNTIFVKNPGDSGTNLRKTYMGVTRLLAEQSIPTPNSLKAFMDPTGTLGVKAGPENFEQFAPFIENGGYNKGQAFTQRVSCPQYLWLLMQGFRWEAALIYNQVLKSAPGGLNDNPDQLVHALFYGWDIRSADGELLDGKGLQQYLYNLILVHLIRNEFLISRQLINPRFATSSETIRSVETNQKTVGSKSKFGELYSWAMMIPHIQGLLLYFLAITYPIACLMIIIPGWHKTIFTWMAFWAWAKLWDVGFALVSVFERSIWASIGSNSDTSGVSPLIAEMGQWGSAQILEYCAMDGCLFATVKNAAGSAFGGAAEVAGTVHEGMQPFYYSLRTLDRSLLLSANLDLDVANAYYIYLLAALYLAVPAIVGQLVLGAKSGTASMISSMFGGVATDGGKAAGAAFTSGWQTRALAGQATVEQTAMAKGMRKEGIAAAALAAGNTALSSSRQASALETANNGIGLIGANQQNRLKSESAAIGAAKSGAQFVASGVGLGGGGKLGGFTSGAIGFAGDMAQLRNQNKGLGLDSANNATRAGNLPEIFGAGQTSAANKMMGERLAAQAKFAGDEAAWRAKRDFSNHLAAPSAAMGVFAGTFQAHSKPQGLEGMAMQGMLNTYNAGGTVQSNAKDSAFYPTTGFFGEVASDKSHLHSNYGSAAVSQEYKQASFWDGSAQLYGGGIDAANTVVGKGPMGDTLKSAVGWMGESVAGHQARNGDPHGAEVTRGYTDGISKGIDATNSWSDGYVKTVQDDVGNHAVPAPGFQPAPVNNNATKP